MAVRLDNLAAERASAEYSVMRLAQLANVSVATITCLEAPGQGTHLGAGTCSHEEADRLCAALGISRATAGFEEL